MKVIENLYHCSSSQLDSFEEEKGNFGYVFLSDKPIDLFRADYVHICDVKYENIFHTKGGWIEDWSYPLYLYLTDKSGELIQESEFTFEKYNNYLGMSYDFWKMVYYDDEEYSCDQIPLLLKAIYPNLDVVVLYGITEGDSSQIMNDYCVFNPNNITIKSSYKK